MLRGERREEGSGWGTHVYLWWIHFDIWQNQYNTVKLKKKKKTWESEYLKCICILSPHVCHRSLLKLWYLKKQWIPHPEPIYLVVEGKKMVRERAFSWPFEYSLIEFTCGSVTMMMSYAVIWNLQKQITLVDTRQRWMQILLWSVTALHRYIYFLNCTWDSLFILFRKWINWVLGWNFKC